MAGYELNLNCRGCSEQYFNDNIKPFLKCDATKPSGDVKLIDWDGEYGITIRGFLVNLPAPDYNCIHVSRQYDLFAVEVVYKGDGYVLDFCSEDEAAELFKRICVLREPFDKLPTFCKTWRTGIDDYMCEQLVLEYRKKSMTEEEEMRYAAALEYLVSIDYDRKYILMLAEYYERKGCDELAEKYFNMAEKFL